MAVPYPPSGGAPSPVRPTRTRAEAIRLDMLATTVDFAYRFGRYALAYMAVWYYFQGFIVLDIERYLWRTDNLLEGMRNVWFLVPLALLMTLLAFRTNPELGYVEPPGDVLVKGVWRSAISGFFEELMYRWMAFFMAMAACGLLDRVVGGAISRFAIQTVWPAFDRVTASKFEQQLFGISWVVGGGMLVSTLWFYAVHQHWFNRIKLWFYWRVTARLLALLGRPADTPPGNNTDKVGFVTAVVTTLVFFWVFFNYGMLAAMIAHGLMYDGSVCLAEAFVMWWRTRR